MSYRSILGAKTYLGAIVYRLQEFSFSQSYSYPFWFRPNRQIWAIGKLVHCILLGSICLLDLAVKIKCHKALNIWRQQCQTLKS